MPSVTYNRGAARIMECALSTTALDLRAALVTGTVTGVDNRDLDTVAAIDALNSSATNIHSERVALTGEAAVEDDANDRANVDAANITFAAAPGVTATALIIYDEGGGTDATRWLVMGVTTGFPQPVDGGLNVTVNDFLRLLTASV